MITRVVMPKLTDTMEEGVVVTWKKEENDAVAAGDILAEIETDKAVMDLEAFGSGFLRKILVGEGQTVKAGSLIAIIGELDDEIEHTLTDESQIEKEEAPAATEPKRNETCGFANSFRSLKKIPFSHTRASSTITHGQSFSPRQIKSRRIWH